MAFQTTVHMLPGVYGDSPIPQEKQHAYCGTNFAVARALGDLCLYVTDLYNIEGLDRSEALCSACEAHPDYALAVLGEI